ncbi:hypothetical protein [Pseudomonas fontis]|uniref:Lipoprotein n=1 Tax=Pseudomonas fontis TaxID=2942633 RepID=A0ABT5NL91_9PSED|nr:hypothetical protein [Pseudomonas fontis]MDD0974840.1 hypothetical protein [Pseudomonas fontis]MDD0989281.1 hypothetical protein [Pseudomonas fontis]
MKRIIALSVVLALSGCVSSPEYVESDFTFEDVSSFDQVGVRAISKSTGKTIEAYGTCTEDERRYFIVRKSSGAYGGFGDKWDVSIEGLRLYAGESHYEDEATFLAAISTLEVVGPENKFGGQQRIRVASAQMDRIPTLCKAKQDAFTAHKKSIYEKSDAENERLTDSVIERTGVQPMFLGKNLKDFNALVRIFQENGTTNYKERFVWVSDGDYRISQVVEGRVLLVSMTNPGLFPTITIITDKEALEGQFWSSVSRGPLQFIGVSTYQTVLGASRQTILFKSI